jgi:hypothetical protein
VFFGNVKVGRFKDLKFVSFKKLRLPAASWYQLSRKSCKALFFALSLGSYKLLEDEQKAMVAVNGGHCAVDGRPGKRS